MPHLLDLFFPKTSLTGEEGAFVTAREERILHSCPIRMDSLELRKVGIKYVDRIVAASSYESSPLLRLAIRRFKYGKVFHLRTALGGLLVSASSLLSQYPDVVLCPVPLHWTRRFFRGFNQSELLAEELKNARGWNHEHLLRRIRPTGHQAWRRRRERIKAMNNAFVVTSIPIPLHIILIDDIATTGMTLDACAGALKQAGAQRVEALVIAKG